MAPPSGPSHKAQSARLVIGISGASGVVFGVRLLELLRDTMIETHLVMSRSAEVTLAYETSYKTKDVKALADRCYDIDDMAARDSKVEVTPLAISARLFTEHGATIMPMVR